MVITGVDYKDILKFVPYNTAHNVIEGIFEGLKVSQLP